MSLSSKAVIRHAVFLKEEDEHASGIDDLIPCSDDSKGPKASEMTVECGYDHHTGNKAAHTRTDGNKGHVTAEGSSFHEAEPIHIDGETSGSARLRHRSHNRKYEAVVTS